MACSNKPLFTTNEEASAVGSGREGNGGRVREKGLRILKELWLLMKYETTERFSEEECHNHIYIIKRLRWPLY